MAEISPPSNECFSWHTGTICWVLSFAGEWTTLSTTRVFTRLGTTNPVSTSVRFSRSLAAAKGVFVLASLIFNRPGLVGSIFPAVVIWRTLLSSLRSRTAAAQTEAFSLASPSSWHFPPTPVHDSLKLVFKTTFPFVFLSKSNILLIMVGIS